MLVIFYPQSNLKNQVVLKKEMIEQIVILEVGPYRPGEFTIQISVSSMTQSSLQLSEAIVRDSPFIMSKGVCNSS